MTEQASEFPHGYPVEIEPTKNTFETLQRETISNKISKEVLINLNNLLGEASEHLSNAMYTTDDESIILKIGTCIGAANGYLVEAQELMLNEITGTEFSILFKKLLKIIDKLEIEALYKRVLDETYDIQYLLLGYELGKYATTINLLRKPITDFIEKHPDNPV